MSTPLCCLLHHQDQAGQTAAVVAPGWGANVIAFCYQARDWAWPVPVLEQVNLATIALKPTSYGIPVLAPTPGRVGRNQNGIFTYRGRTYRINPSRHGLLRNIPWTVTKQQHNMVTCTVEIKPTGVDRPGDLFPFDFRAEYQIEVSARTLHCNLRLENTGAITQPLNVGWHPYLHRSGSCRVCIPANSKWELDKEPEPTPTGRILAVVGSEDFRKGRTLESNEHWDDVFTNLSNDSEPVCSWTEEDASVLLNDNRYVEYNIRRSIMACSKPRFGASHGIRNIQLFTPLGRNAISIEPLSAPPDAINLLAKGHYRSDVCEVGPGDEVTFELLVIVSATRR